MSLTATLPASPGVTAFDLLTAPLPAPRDPGAPLRLLDITKYFGPDTGGIRTYLVAKAEWLASQAGISGVLVIPGPADAVIDDAGRRYEIQGPRMPGQRTYRWLLNVAKLRRIILHERPTLIEIGSALLVPSITRRANRAWGAPMVWFYHTHLPRIVNPAGALGSWPRRLIERLAWWHVRHTAAHCRATFAASETIARELESHGVAQVRRVRLGVDLDLFNPARRQRAPAVRARLGVPDGPLAVFAGRFTPEKQLATVLAAWPVVHARTGATLVLMGHGPIEADLRVRHPHPGILWQPFETDRSLVADVLAAADLYVAPGPAETFGLSALEALASGTPILSVDSGGAAELVARSGAGRRYAPGDATECATQAMALLPLEAENLRSLARQYAETRHAWPVVLADLAAEYRMVSERPAVVTA